jgi:dihydropyrimidinase
MHNLEKFVSPGKKGCMTRVDLLISGGRVVAGNAVVDACVAISGERIVALCSPDAAIPATEVVDARGLYVLPGAIDPHVHFKIFNSMVDDFTTASTAAAYGGVTTIIPFVSGDERMSVAEFVDYWIDQGQRQSVVDFAMHCRLRPDAALIDQVPDAIMRGITSVKMFQAYRKRGLLFSDDLLLRTMEIVGRHGGLAMVHAENGWVIDHLEDRLAAIGRTGPQHYLASRPHLAEAEAVARAIVLADVAVCPLYIVHLSTREGLEAIAAARARGQHVYAETCPQYLYLTDAEMTRQKGLAKIAPPLRWDRDRDALWGGLDRGDVQTVGSDHAPFTVAEKRIAETNIFEAGFGMPGIETMAPLLWSAGLGSGSLSLPQTVAALSENTAKIFGLYPNKGAIRVGSDADLVLLDPDTEWTIQGAELHSQAGYTCFEGRRVKGKVVASFLRGRPLLREGKIQQAPGYGRYIPRPAATP